MTNRKGLRGTRTNKKEPRGRKTNRKEHRGKKEQVGPIQRLNLLYSRTRKGKKGGERKSILEETDRKEGQENLREYEGKKGRVKRQGQNREVKDGKKEKNGLRERKVK